MAPALLPGDRLVVARGRPRIGGVVLATDPRDPARELVKRVVGISAGGIELRGDNPVYSTDGRSFGAIDPAAVRWRAIARYWPPPRIGRVPAAIRRLDRVDEGGEPACAVPEALIAG